MVPIGGNGPSPDEYLAHADSEIAKLTEKEDVMTMDEFVAFQSLSSQSLPATVISHLLRFNATVSALLVFNQYKINLPTLLPLQRRRYLEDNLPRRSNVSTFLCYSPVESYAFVNVGFQSSKVARPRIRSFPGTAKHAGRLSRAHHPGFKDPYFTW